VSWSELPPDIREIAEHVCTRKQLDVLKLKASGAGYRRIGALLGIAPMTVRGHLEAAQKNIVDELERRGETL
jgi:DNA-binding CsgD family transcriptional regulator